MLFLHKFPILKMDCISSLHACEDCFCNVPFYNVYFEFQAKSAVSILAALWRVGITENAALFGSGKARKKQKRLNVGESEKNRLVLRSKVCI